MEDAKDTQDAIQQAIKEEQAAKKQRKAVKHAQEHAAHADRKGKTLGQVEEEEGGPIRESLVGMAHVKRAAKRKRAGGVADTDLVEDVEEAEEELQVPEEDGVQLEAFNLQEERRLGYFDESGTYVQNKKTEEEAEDANDAWLASEEAQIVDTETLRRIAERQKAAEAAESGPLTAVSIARLKYEIFQLLKPEENVLRALKRLGGSGANRVGARAGKRAKRGAAAAIAPPADPADKQRFERLTELASTLIEAGEADVYTQERDYFKRCAAVYIDVEEDEEEAGEGAGGGILGQGPSRAAYEDADEDMFASNDDAAGGAEKEGGQEGGTARVEGGVAEAGEASVDFSSWPVKELRRFLQERGVDTAGVLEKKELVEKAAATAAVEARGEGASPSVQAPPGYAFDAASGLWRSEDSGMLWDAASGGFYNPVDQKWYSYDADKGWVAW